MKPKTLSKIALVSMFTGAVIEASMVSYYMMGPSVSPILKEYQQIERKLNQNPQVRLGDLESKSMEIINDANILKAERDKIISNSNFVESKKKYESEKRNIQSILGYSSILGFGLMFFSFIPLLLSEGKERESNKREYNVSQR